MHRELARDILWPSPIHWDDFAVTFFVTGNGFTTLSVEIYSRARQGISLEINALSIWSLFSLLLVVGYYFISRDTSKNTETQTRFWGGGNTEMKITITFYRCRRHHSLTDILVIAWI